MCAGKDTHSEKTWEDSKLSPSAIADPQGEQEVKAKSESWMITKHWRKGGLQKLEEFSFFLFFSLLGFNEICENTSWTQAKITEKQTLELICAKTYILYKNSLEKPLNK